MLTKATNVFIKYNETLMHVLSQLEKRAKPYTCLLDFVEGDKVILLALICQNSSHPKNHHRTEAIQNKSYIELLTHGAACEYMNNLLQTNLLISVLAVETEILAKLQAEAQSQGISQLISAPDVYYMLAMLNSGAISNG